MTLKRLLKFVAAQNKWLQERYPDERDSKQRRLLRLAKLMEEAGELAEQILGSLKQQRPTKKKKLDSGSVEEEVADVLITTLLLAHVMGVDVEKALRMRVGVIEKRRRT